MITQILLLILFTVLILFFKPIIAGFVKWVVLMQHLFENLLSRIFPHDATWHIVISVLAIILIPLLIALLVAFITYLIRRRQSLAVTSFTMWLVWVIIVVALLA